MQTTSSTISSKRHLHPKELNLFFRLSSSKCTLFDATNTTPIAWNVEIEGITKRPSSPNPRHLKNRYLFPSPQKQDIGLNIEPRSHVQHFCVLFHFTFFMSAQYTITATDTEQIVDIIIMLTKRTFNPSKKTYGTLLRIQSIQSYA